MVAAIARRLTDLQAGPDMVDAARQIEGKCFDSAKDAADYARKVEKRLSKAARALAATANPPPAPGANMQARKRSREDEAQVQEAKRPKTDTARDLLRDHGATLEWWKAAPGAVGKRLRAIIEAATSAGTCGNEARLWAATALQKVEKLEKVALSLIKQLATRAGALSEVPGYCLKLKESRTALEGHLSGLAPQWAPSSIGEASVESWCDVPADDIVETLRGRLGACVGVISRDALGAYRVECPRDSFTATLRLRVDNGRIVRAWISCVRFGEASPASSFEFWRRVGEKATEAADECIATAGGATLGVVARLLVAVAKARDAAAATAAARHKSAVESGAPTVPDFARATGLLERERARAAI